jgi:DNA topoisomerase-1
MHSPTAPKLFIVESPVKAKTIQKYLSDDYLVRATIGHIADIPENAPIDVDDQFQAHYELSDNGQKVIGDLRAEMKKCSEIILATDPDREGEMIAYHVVQFLQPTIPVSRVTFNAVTEKAIDEALKSPRDIDMDLVEAARTRRILDRLFGFELSAITRSRIRSNVTIGRVQAPGLRLVVEREFERLAFVPAEYMDVTIWTATDPQFEARLVSIGGSRLATGKDFDDLGQLTKNVMILAPDRAERIADALLTGTAELVVASMITKAATSNPRPPLDSSALFQEAGARLGMTADEIDSLMNSLYRKSHITYPRTDIRVHSAETRVDISAAIVREYGESFLASRERFATSKKKMAQGAHYAIAPTEMRTRKPQGISAREQLLYTLIWEHTIATQMSEATGTTTTVTLRAADPAQPDEEWVITASNTSYMNQGYRIVRGERSETMPMPNLTVGDVVAVESTAAEEHRTKAPARFTEPTLIKALEERGIGRPSTYKTTISKLRDRFVWNKEGSTALIPTVTAFATYRLLEMGFESLVDYDFTRDMEERLDQVAEDGSASLQVLSDFYFGSDPSPGLQTLLASAASTVDPRGLWALDLGAHPESGHRVYVRPGLMKNKRYSPYLECDGKIASIPDRTCFEDLTLDAAVELLARPKRPPIGEIDGLPVYVKVTLTGAYFQLGDADTLPKKTRPRTASLLSTMNPETVSIDDAKLMFSLPRQLGVFPDTGEEVSVRLGPYGGYVAVGEEKRSLKDEASLFSITLDQACDLLRTPKKPRRKRRSSKEPRRRDPE